VFKILTNKHPLSSVVAAFFLALFSFSTSSYAGELLVYSSTDADNLKYYMEEFQKDNPSIKVNVVRESTGTMAAKLMAEKDNPQADFLFEMAATVALNMEAEGMFHEYVYLLVSLSVSIVYVPIDEHPSGA